jgi:hypothetical protein
MSDLSIFELDSSVEVEEATDSLAGGKRSLDSGLYDFVIKLAYINKSKPKETNGKPDGEATSVNLVLVNAKKEEVRITEWVTSGKLKGCKPYYEKDSKKFPLPGYSKINDFCLRATGKTLAQQKIEEKVIKLWDYDAKAETNQKKQVLTDCLLQKISVGLIEVLEDKYSDPSTKITVNVADKWFDVDSKLTTAEILAGKTEPKFSEIWKAKWDGVQKDTTTKTDAVSGAPASTPNAAPDLFAT